jgi:dTDP-4-dehydrorhamnose 3,5-epimerase
MPIRQGPLDGLWISHRRTYPDDRGFFREAFRISELAEVINPTPTFVQANHSRSRCRVLRGLHAENWEKLVYVPRGEVFTALADLRPESRTFGRTATFRLGEEHPISLFVPRGLAHGYYVLSDEADYVYQVSAYYDGSDTRAVAWDDPDLAIDWPDCNPLLSERDRHNPRLRELFPRWSATPRSPVLA